MILFDELIGAQDFREAVDGIGKEFRKRFALPPIHQLGITVPDVEAAAAELEDRGLGPFFIAGAGLELWRERYEERGFRGKMGMAYHQGIEIELLEPGQGSSFYGDCVDCQGRPVVQHLGFRVQDVDVWASILSQAGYPVWVRGRISALPPLGIDFAYMDTVADSGVIMEFICFKLAGIPFKPLPGLFHAAGRLQKRLGKRALHL